MICQSKKLKLRFEFSVGVCPIYASESPEFVPEIQSGLDYSIQRISR